MSTKRNPIGKKFLLGAMLMVVGAAAAPYTHAMPSGGFCSECVRLLGMWICFPC